MGTDSGETGPVRKAVEAGTIESQDAEARSLGLWVACHEPERPVDGLTAFHSGCRACLLAAQASEVAGVSLQLPGGETVHARLRAAVVAYDEQEG